MTRWTTRPVLVAVLIVAAAACGTVEAPADRVGASGSSSAGSPARPAAPPDIRPDSLRALADQRGAVIGGAANTPALRDDEPYREVLRSEFNVLTPETAMKWYVIHPERGRYDFRAADELVDFAEANGMKVRGHNLVWFNENPTWLTNADFTRDEAIEVLRDHIHTVVGRYKGRVAEWDVVNEAIDERGSLRSNVWFNAIGPEYIDLAFQFAHEADPDAKLYYNDYYIERPNAKADATEHLVITLRDRGVPIHGIGFQMHYKLDHGERSEDDLALAPSELEVVLMIDRYNRAGFEVAITEADVWIDFPATESMLEEQRLVYGDWMRACLNADNCHTFVMWGFTDRYSWVPGTFPGYGSALIFDEELQPKPAYEGLRDQLR